jgi:hypothetical protein
MATRSVDKFLLKRSNVVGKKPTVGQLDLGEVALNTADAKMSTLYTGGATGATEVREIGWNRVNITGDTMTGGLIAPSLSATTITGGLFNISQIPSNNNTLTQVLVRDGGTGEINYRDASSLGGGTGATDTFITGQTFSNNYLTTTRNDDVSITTEIDGFTGLTVNGAISATTISAVTVTATEFIDSNGTDINDSQFKSNGEMYMAGNATSTSIAVVSTPVKVAGTTTTGFLNNFTHNIALSRLTYTGETTQRFHITTTLTAEGDGNALFLFFIAKNGVEQSNIEIQQQFSSNRSSVTLNGIIQLAQNEYVELWVQNDTNNKNITIVYENVTLVQI